MSFLENFSWKNMISIEHSEIDFLRELFHKHMSQKVVVSNRVPQDIISAFEGFNGMLYRVNCFPKELEKIGGEIDFLLLDGADRMPEELLDFIAAFPYLKRDAIVAVYDTVQQAGEGGRKTGSSILMRNVRAQKFPHHLELYPDVLEQLSLGIEKLSKPHFPIYNLANIMAAFQLTEDTSKHIGDLFSALYAPWPTYANVEYLRAYEPILKKRYKAEYVQIYLDVMQKNERLLNPYENVIRVMTSSLFSSFPHVLLYGKGKYGKIFLSLVQKLDIRIDGFVVTDGRTTAENFEGFPVYFYSQIPFRHEETLIIQTANSEEIENQLQMSDFRWIKLPREFWNAYVWESKG